MFRRLWKFLTSLRLTVVLLGLSILLVFVGTVAQADEGLYTAQSRYFKHWFVSGLSFFGHHVPLVLPGGYLLGTALLQFIEQHFVSWGAPRLILLGLFMIVITLFTTDGLAGIPDQIKRLVRGRGAPSADDATAATMGGGGGP